MIRLRHPRGCCGSFDTGISPNASCSRWSGCGARWLPDERRGWRGGMEVARSAMSEKDCRVLSPAWALRTCPIDRWPLPLVSTGSIGGFFSGEFRLCVRIRTRIGKLPTCTRENPSARAHPVTCSAVSRKNPTTAGSTPVRHAPPRRHSPPSARSTPRACAKRAAHRRPTRCIPLQATVSRVRVRSSGNHAKEHA